MRRRYDILMVWSIDRLGRSVLHVANALAELDAAGIRLYCDQQGINSSTPMGRAMIQMASVFGEQERSMLRSRVLAGLDRVRQQGKKLGRPKVSPKVENAIRTHLSAGNGILKVAALVGVGSGTVQRVKREMAGQLQLVARLPTVHPPDQHIASTVGRDGAKAAEAATPWPHDHLCLAALSVRSLRTSGRPSISEPCHMSHKPNSRRSCQTFGPWPSSRRPPRYKRH